MTSAAAAKTLRFKSPYKMADHGSSENGLNWADGNIKYNKPDEHVALPITLLLAAMASPTTSKRSTTDVAAAAAAAKQRRGKRNLPTEERQLPPDASLSSAYSDICTYWAANPAFDPQRVLLRRLFFHKCKQDQIRVCRILPARDYLPLVEFGVIRICGSKVIILTDEQVYTLAQCLPTIADAMCKEGKEVTSVIKCESGNFRVGVPKRRRGLTRLYVGSEYICLTSLDMHYLARMFNIVRQQLRDYVLALPDSLSYVTMSLTWVVYVEQMPNASTHINCPHMYEELVSFV